MGGISHLSETTILVEWWNKNLTMGGISHLSATTT